MDDYGRNKLMIYLEYAEPPLYDFCVELLQQCDIKHVDCEGKNVIDAWIRN
jgi:hypothetical protein